MRPPEDIDVLNPSLCCLAVILLAFASLLNSLGAIEPEKARTALQSIARVFPAASPSEAASIIPKDTDNLRWEAVVRLAEGANANIEHENTSLRISFSADLLFKDGDDELYAKAKDALRKLGGAIITANALLEIEAHTDNVVSLSARYASLWTLSIQRAYEIYRLMRAEGLRESRLQAAGFGAASPTFSNVSEDGRAKNRRIVLVLRPAEDA